MTLKTSRIFGFTFKSFNWPPWDLSEVWLLTRNPTPVLSMYGTAVHVDEQLFDAHAQNILDLLSQKKTVTAGHKLAVQLQDTNITNNF